MSSIIGIGTYLPRLRLERRSMASALGWLTPAAGAGSGSRCLGFWDEDSLTMAVAAARAALPEAARDQVHALSFATTTPPFAEPQNAALVHAALRLPETCQTHDATGTPRATLLALQAALDAGQPTLVAAADRPVMPAGSIAESRAGDGGAAAWVGPGKGILTYLGGASLAAPFIHRTRAAGASLPLDWEERWQRDEGYLKLVPAAIDAALRTAGLAPTEIDHLILPCPIPRTSGAVARAAGLTSAHLASDLADTVGDTGAAHALLMLAAALPQMAAGQKVLLAQFGQGATALIFEAQEGVGIASSVHDQIEAGIAETNYLKLLAFQGGLDWDRGLRGRYAVPEIQTTAYRNAEALLGFVACRDAVTGLVQFPPGQQSGGDPWPLAERGGRIATITADLLAFSRHPPNCYGLVDFNGGGRLMMDVTDPGAAQLKPGDPVRFEFRLKDMDETTGFRRYFWKAVHDPAQRVGA